jgi:glyoxylase-like metal-dependent hydrolase (beta-lactamase superfamily II)
MYKRKWVVLIMVLTSFIYNCSANKTKNIPQNGDLPPDIYVTRLSERILQLKVRGPLGTNIVVIATQKGLVVIDTYTAPIIFEQVSDIVQKEFGRCDYAYVINSHDHVDHAGGAGFFKGIIMVGQEELFKALRNRHAGRRQWQSWYRGRIHGWIRGREEKLTGLDKNLDEAKELAADVRLLRRVDKDFESGFLIMPESPKEIIFFKDSHILELGNITIECYACKAGHSHGDILIYIPEEEFLFTGDVTQLYFQKNVNMEKWLTQLDYFTQPDKPVKIILGGHDKQPFIKQNLRCMYDYFKEIWESAQKTHKQGISLEQIQKRSAIDNIPSAKSLLDTPFVNTMSDFKMTHMHNIELVVNKLNQR